MMDESGIEYVDDVAIIREGPLDYGEGTVFGANVKSDGISHMTGCFVPKDNKIYVWLVKSMVKGDFKKMMTASVKYWKTSKVEFTSIANDNLPSLLKNFKLVMRDYEDEPQLCMVGDWVV